MKINPAVAFSDNVCEFRGRYFEEAVFTIFDKRISDGHYIEMHNSMEMQQVHLPVEETGKGALANSIKTKLCV